MKLRVKKFEVSAGRPIIFLNVKDAKEIDTAVGERVSLSFGKKNIVAQVDVVNDFLHPGEVSLTEDVVNFLSVKTGKAVNVKLVAKPKSSAFINKKMNGKKLSRIELKTIMNDIVTNTLTEAEVAQFVVAVYTQGMNFDETVYLTEAMYQCGDIMKWGKKIIADKHCIGGIAGNRTTPIVVSICASAGITMPKTSSRAITSAAGTADVVETMAKVDFSGKRLQEIVNKTGACLAWGGSLGLSPADDKLIKTERALKLDPRAQLLASIFSKKLAAGSNHILIDIPHGKGAKVSTHEAKDLRDKFLKLGRRFGVKVEVVLTDGLQPIGNGIGPVLEMLDVLRVLRRNNSPKDLEKKAVYLAGLIIELTGKAKKGKGEELALEMLNSGKAYQKFNEILDAQGRNNMKMEPGEWKFDVKAEQSGIIEKIDNKGMNGLASVLGCPADKRAGIYLYKHLREEVNKGELVFTMYAESKEKLDDALSHLKRNSPVEIIKGGQGRQKQVLIEEEIKS